MGHINTYTHPTSVSVSITLKMHVLRSRCTTGVNLSTSLGRQLVCPTRHLWCPEIIVSGTL